MFIFRLFEFCRHLEGQRIPFEVRSLPVGDFLFQLSPTESNIPNDISAKARSHLKQANQNMRLNKITVFPVIFERKDASDCAMSMMDGMKNRPYHIYHFVDCILLMHVNTINKK